MSVSVVRHATFGTRLGAWLIDAIPHSIVPSIVFRVTGDWIYGLAAYFIVGLLWSIIPEARTGSTFGKLIVGIKAVDQASGGPIGLPRSAVRWFVKYVVCSVLPVGYLWYFRNGESRTWADRAAGTVVVTPYTGSDAEPAG